MVPKVSQAPEAAVNPSGGQYEISHGDQRAVAVEVGGGLRAYTVAGDERLDGYDVDAVCSGGRGQPLMPWPNRLRDGRYSFDGSDYQLGLTEPSTKSAIHGLIRWVNWQAVEHHPARLVMEYVLHPQTGWPGSLQLGIEYQLDDGGLRVTTTATNVGTGPCPFGVGFHPYLTLGTPTVDELTLRAPGSCYLEADDRGTPVDSHPVQGSELDFRSGRRVGPARLDHCVGDLERDPDRIARVRIATEDGQRQATLWMDEAYRYVMLFTGDTLPPADRRRGLAVEPMSCPPNALQSNEALVRLEPGEDFVGRWGIDPGS